MVESVLDASAVLAVAFKEPGAERVIARLAFAAISTVNLSEAGAKLIDKGFTADEAFHWLDALRLEIVTFDRDQAAAAAALREATKSKRLSFADRACVALAAAHGATAVTTDRVWADLDLPCPVELIL